MAGVSLIGSNPQVHPSHSVFMILDVWRSPLLSNFISDYG